MKKADISSEFFKAIEFIRNKWVDYLRCTRNHCDGGNKFIKLLLVMEETTTVLKFSVINVVNKKTLTENTPNLIKNS